MSLAQGNNTPTRPMIEPGSPDPESDALTTRPVRSPNNDAKRRVYGKNLAKKQKCSVPCSVLFSSRYIDEKKIFRQRFVTGSG